MSDTPAIRLKRGEGRAFKAGGPWIYDNEIAEILGEPADGGIVRIEDYNGYPLGVGFLNRASTIAVRVLSRDAGAVIDRDFLERRVRAAWQYRKDTVDTSSCRVIFGEADFLPGLVVDKFADVLVVESLALGIDRLKSTILSLLVDLLKEDGISVRGIYERSDAKVRLKEGMERVKGFLSDPFDPVVEIVENGVRYQVDVAEGQKTGFFLDQKYNRLAIQPLARIARERGLNVWAYTGYTYKRLLAGEVPDALALLEQVDVLVDGPFVEAEKSYAALFRGSANQRLIDVPKSLAAGAVVLWERPDPLAHFTRPES